MQNEMVAFAGSESPARGYLVYPPQAEPKPGLIVLQEWWGLNAHIMDVTRRAAGAGYVALAPDLYHGRVTAEPDQARKLAMELDRPRALDEIDAAVEYLLALESVNPKRIGIIGFCMGGGLALHAAARNPQVNAAVAFYGGGAPHASDFAQSNAAIMNIVGDQDGVLPSIETLDAGLAEAGRPHELAVYPGCQHAFFNDTRLQVYQPDAAQAAWAKTIKWLATYVQAQPR